ncbi:MAG TPA: diacylglycerol kinase [Candidatus Aphodousia faecipullorum]|nr:diacylglycerol kinase [Candidatus Aphodousia faecipullorum]
MSEIKDANDLKGKSGLRRLINACGYSRDGFTAAYQHEEAFRQEFWLLVVAAVIAFALPISLMQSILIVSVHLLLLIVEILNSAVEAVVDRIGPEIHPLSKRAKDMGSCAVSLTIGLCLMVWISVLYCTFFA